MYIWIIFKNLGLQHIHCLQLCFPCNTFGGFLLTWDYSTYTGGGNGTHSRVLATVHGVAESDMPERLTLTHSYTHTQHTSTTLVFSHLKFLGEFLSISQFLLLLFNGCVGLHRLEILRSEPSHSSNQWNLGHVSKLGPTTQFLVVWPWAGYNPLTLLISKTRVDMTNMPTGRGRL